MAAAYTTPRSKCSTDVVYDKSRQEQLKEDEDKAIAFLNTSLGLSIRSGELHTSLKDGVHLCNLINKIRPGIVKHVGQKNLLFVKMDNITSFLQGARQLGLNEFQLFGTADLLEAKDMAMVMNPSFSNCHLPCIIVPRTPLYIL
ncbi:calponin homology domain-containing protein [Phycomyces blakesleeanus]|uniref:Calponin homology domain-containing protein n=1 Tax=Phycomyces blakesleeanus TaxID=4837 RepID=A0ABR3ATX0_PHYBL